jgi:hypothetical protein
MPDLDPKSFSNLCEEVRHSLARRPVPQISEGVTKSEWQAALKTDKAMLKKYETDLKTLESGGKVKNLTVAGAKSAIKGLKKVIANKEKLIASLSEKKR